MQHQTMDMGFLLHIWPRTHIWCTFKVCCATWPPAPPILVLTHFQVWIVSPELVSVFAPRCPHQRRAEAETEAEPSNQELSSDICPRDVCIQKLATQTRSKSTQKSNLNTAVRLRSCNLVVDNASKWKAVLPQSVCILLSLVVLMMRYCSAPASSSAVISSPRGGTRDGFGGRLSSR